MLKEPKIAVLLGATASGKTALADMLQDSCVLLSADSLAVFKELEIISARPSANYYGVGICSILESFSVGDFLEEFSRAKRQALQEQKPLLIVGGTSFYVAALFNGLSPAVPRLEHFPSNEQIAALCAQDAGAKIAANDTYRLQRWWEIYSHSQMMPSQWLALHRNEPALKRASVEVFELVWPRQMLLERISERSAKMLASGAISECASALELAAKEWANHAQNATQQAFLHNKALNCIGAKQICQALLESTQNSPQNDMQSAAKCLENDKLAKAKLSEEISLRTRQYAKRQRTFNRSLGARELDALRPSSEHLHALKTTLEINQ